MTQLPVRDGTAYGEIRAPLDKAKLVPYLEANVAGFKGPLDIKQFGVSNSARYSDPSSDSPTPRTSSRRRPRAMCSAARRPASS